VAAESAAERGASSGADGYMIAMAPEVDLVAGFDAQLVA
jgi:hypothetical protein